MPPPVLYTIPVLVDSKVNLENSGVLIPDGMLAKVAGDSRFKVGEGDKTWNELEFVQPDAIQLGGGLATDQEGKIYVDFSQMPTDKFETLLKSIYIPILLKANLNVYVNGATGSDVLSSGRGLSADMAFKTIQACINYVTQTYNVTSYVLRINCENVVHNGILVLSEYQRTSGYIVIGKDMSKSYQYGLTINNTTNLMCLKVEKSYWSLGDTIINHDTVNITETNHNACIYVYEGAKLDLWTSQINLFNEKQTHYCYSYSVLSTENNGYLRIYNGNIINSNVTTSGTSFPTMLALNINSQIQYAATNANEQLKIKGTFYNLISILNWSYFHINGVFKQNFAFDPDFTVKNKGFLLKNCSSCSILGKGPAFVNNTEITKDDTSSIT